VHHVLKVAHREVPQSNKQFTCKDTQLSTMHFINSSYCFSSVNLGVSVSLKWRHYDVTILFHCLTVLLLLAVSLLVDCQITVDSVGRQRLPVCYGLLPDNTRCDTGWLTCWASSCGAVLQYEGHTWTDPSPATRLETVADSVRRTCSLSPSHELLQSACAREYFCTFTRTEWKKWK